MSTRTPFYDLHEKAGAKIIDFGGFDMPVQYEGIRSEHNAVRERVGMFDVSHMGEFMVTGPGALDLVQQVTINDASVLAPGKAQYSAMCYEDGGIVDDLLVYMLDEERYMLVVNASNIEKDFEWIEQQNSFGAELENRSPQTCLLAVQGPKSVETLQKLTGVEVDRIPFYNFATGSLGGCDRMIISATGYTGEKGFELYFETGDCDPESVWNAIMEAGEEFGIEPCGLGARDTLRLEMGYALYGNDISKDTNPLEARLGWLTKADKGSFTGRDAILQIKKSGVKRKLTGFVIDDPRAIPRSGYTIADSSGEEIGFVTSGTRSITLDRNIGMGYVPVEFASEGTEVQVEVRNRVATATIQNPPFLKT